VDRLIVVDLGQLRIPLAGNLGGLVERKLFRQRLISVLEAPPGAGPDRVSLEPAASGHILLVARRRATVTDGVIAPPGRGESTPNRMDLMRRHSSGFSLVEVGVALAVGAILLGLSVALWGSAIRERRVVHVAEDIAGLLRFAQQAAVANSVDACLYRVVIESTHAEAYAVARDEATGTCTSPEVVTLVKRTAPFPAGVVVTATPAGPVEFTSAGGLSSGSSRPEAVSISVSFGDRMRTVRVEPSTGRVEVAP
jgi:Tfp pilus assembly protein FimT